MAKPISYVIQNEDIVEGFRVYGRTNDEYTQYFNNDNAPYQRYVIGLPVSKYKINNTMKRKCNFTKYLPSSDSYASFSWNYKVINDLSTNYYDNETESKFIMFNKPDRYKLMNLNMVKLQEFPNYVRYYDGISVRYGDYKETILNSDGDTICTYYIYSPSNIHTSIDATKDNTYTNSYLLTYNKTKKKVLNTEFCEELPYCRVLEESEDDTNTKQLVNYLRNPIDRQATYGGNARYITYLGNDNYQTDYDHLTHREEYHEQWVWLKKYWGYCQYEKKHTCHFNKYNEFDKYVSSTEYNIYRCDGHGH